MNLQQELALGISHHQAGRLAEAERIYRKILAEQPNHADAMNMLGVLAGQTGRFGLAEDLIRQAIVAFPNNANYHANLGRVLEGINRLEDAIVAYRQAVRLAPRLAEAQFNLGVALQRNRQFDEAVTAYWQVIRLKPDFAGAYSNLGILLHEKGQLDEAIACYRQTIRLKPDFAEVHNSMGSALMRTGQLDDATESFRRAVELKPDFTQAHDNLIYTLHFHPCATGAEIREELRRWNERYAEPLKKFIQPCSNSQDPERRLRIGYVSPDFREHAVGQNLLPLLSEHDHRQMEIFCYSSAAREDAMTEQFRRYSDCWRSIVEQLDSHVIELIRRDRIDILVDLALHTPGNRLAIFAQKPAPVQVTFGGYPGSTGLDTVDYRLTDPHLDPPGLHHDFYSETSIRLRDTFWCYDPLSVNLAVNQLPAHTQHYATTFGCLNSFCKVSDIVLALWARILKTIPEARLLLLAPEESSQKHVLLRLGRDGIIPERVEFVAKQSRMDYLQTYQRIDIGLDTIPYNGHTTNLDSFWMGVPVVTLVGNTAVGRAGLSQLTNLGLQELIAQTPEQYVQIATDLAHDLPRLAELRRTLRPRMESSPLMDAPRFARSVEAIYRQMWRRWCAQLENRR